MPVCEGRPGQSCPENKNDKTVHLAQGDLMLCDGCERARFGDSRSNVAAATRTTRKDKGKSSTRHEHGAHASDIHEDEHSQIKTSGEEANIATGLVLQPLSEEVKPKIVVNELLAYVDFYRHNSNTDALRRVVLTSFSPLCVTAAKKLLVQQYLPLLESCPLTAERRTSAARAACEVEIEDIIGLFHLIDAQNISAGVMFAAVNLDAMPKFGPEEINIAAVVQRQIRLEDAVDRINDTVQGLNVNRCDKEAETASRETITQLKLDELQQKFNSLSSSISASLSQLNSVCNAALTVTNADRNSGLTTSATERSSNLIIFGVKEDRDATVWQRNVDAILQFVVDKPVDVVDMYRLGRYNATKTRPVLVKLRAVWDRRLILNKSRKLKDYNQRGIFIAPDEPIEVRRKQTMDRLRYRAERDNRQTEIIDGVLHIDGVATYSLVNGLIKNNNNNNG